MEQVPDGLELSPYFNYPSLDLRSIPFGTHITLNCGRVWRKTKGIDYPWYIIEQPHGGDGNCTCADSLDIGDVRWIPSMPLWEVASFDGPLNWMQWADLHGPNAPQRMNRYEADGWIGLSTKDYAVTCGYTIFWKVMNRLTEIGLYEESGSVFHGSLVWTRKQQ